MISASKQQPGIDLAPEARARGSLPAHAHLMARGMTSSMTNGGLCVTRAPRQGLRLRSYT
jgi:hypothetical protein